MKTLIKSLLLLLVISGIVTVPMAYILDITLWKSLLLGCILTVFLFTIETIVVFLANVNK
jgi:hypothetical protein